MEAGDVQFVITSAFTIERGNLFYNILTSVSRSGNALISQDTLHQYTTSPLTPHAPVIMQDAHLCTSLLLIHTGTSLKDNVETDEWGGGQLGVCININIRTPPPHPLPTPPVHVCVFLWQPQDACTTAPMNRDVFYFSVQCLCINWAWRGAGGCPVWLAACSGWRAPACLSVPPCAASPALRRRRGWECHSTEAAWVELCKQ